MGRKICFRNLVQSFLIVCEGEETEPNYFESFHVPGDVKSLDIRGVGRSTENLAKEAIRLKTIGDYDQVWIVFDIDNTTANQVNRAIYLAQKNKIHVAYSNQAFELWFLLHFNFYQTSMTRPQYIKKLNEVLGFGYKKNDPNLYRYLLKKQITAIDNSKKLLEMYNPENAFQDDPSTTVFRLVEELNRYTPDSRR
jgi:hypothetical protein